MLRALWRQPWARRSVIAAIGILVVIVGGPLVYIHLVKGDPPPPLSLPVATTTPSATPSAATSGIANGSWKVSTGSQAGYRVKEVLFGQNTTAVGRTHQISGSMRVAQQQLTAAVIVVDLATVTSDDGRRDDAFHGRIMSVDDFPTATFTLATPVRLPASALTGAETRLPVTGELTLRGITRSVEVPLQAQLSGDAIRVSGQIPVAFDDWGIPNPSFGPVSTEDNGIIELLVVFRR